MDGTAQKVAYSILVFVKITSVDINAFMRLLFKIQLSFAEFVVTGLKSNRTSKTNNQNPFKRILTTDKIRPNGI